MFYGNKFLFFGGYSHEQGRSNDIYQLSSPKFYWKKLGKLNEARHGHSVAIVDDQFLVVGGNGNFDTERCKYATDKVECVKQEPKINMWKFYPALMPVSDNYCK